MKKLLERLKSYSQIDAEILQYLMEVAEYETYKKNQLLLRERQICKHIRFIESGMIRIFRSGETKETTTWIQREGAFFTAADSVFSQTPSVENIETLENCVCWSLTHQHLEEGYRRCSKFGDLVEAIKTDYYRILTERTALLNSMSPRERIEWLKKTDPELIQRAPKKYLYTYLNISHTFSI
jgi:CRP-like cAMP-binding protein